VNGALAASDVERLACPTCRRALRFVGVARAGRLLDGELQCACGARFPVADGFAHLYIEGDVRGADRLMRVIYDRLAPLHDPFVWAAMHLFRVGMTASAMRDFYLARVELGRLRPRGDGKPLRVLEVGVGGGINLPLVEARAPAPVEYWGVDLARGMLRVCRRRLRARGDQRARLLLCDAHALPFPDGAFDRVFHVGAIANWRDPARGLAEMARVAAPGTPIVVVDEQLDRARASRWNRAAFRLVTFYDRDPHCPVEHLPPGARDVRVEQINRFFYCLTFRSAPSG